MFNLLLLRGRKRGNMNNIKANFLVESYKVSNNYNKENAVNYLVTAMELINDEEKALNKLDKVKNSVVWINLLASIYQDYYNVAIKEQFYSLNNTVGKQLVEQGVNRSTFNKFKKAIEDYINMLTTLEAKINACL